MISYLQARIAEARAEIEELEKQLAQAIEYADWPKEHDTVWFANSWGEVTLHALSDLLRCNDIVAQNHLFRTEQEAKNEVLFCRMRSGVRVVEEGRQYWTPQIKGTNGVLNTLVPVNSESEGVMRLRFFAASGMLFLTEEECREWFAHWGDTLKGGDQ